MKIIDIYDKINNPTLLTNLYFNNKIVAIRDDFSLNRYMTNNIRKKDETYKRLYKIDIDTKDVQKIDISKDLHIIKKHSVEDILYGVSLEREEGLNKLKFIKLLCEKGEEYQIGYIDIPNDDDLITYGGHIDDIDIPIHIINDRYILVTYFNECDFTKDKASSGKIFLIDSKEEKMYNVNHNLINGDSLLRSNMLDFKNISLEDKFIFKTGMEYLWEKEKIFDEINTGRKIKNMKYHLKETLGYFDIKSFIKTVKEGKDKLSPKVLEKKDERGAIEVIGTYESSIVYLLANLEIGAMYIKKYNIKNDTYKEVKLQKKYTRFLLFNNKVYGVASIKNTITIDDIFNRKTIFNNIFKECPSFIIYIDDKKVIFQRDKIISGEKSVIICDTKTNEIVKEFDDRMGYFNKKANALILYKGLRT